MSEPPPEITVIPVPVAPASKTNRSLPTIHRWSRLWNPRTTELAVPSDHALGHTGSQRLRWPRHQQNHQKLQLPPMHPYRPRHRLLLLKNLRSKEPGHRSRGTRFAAGPWRAVQRAACARYVLRCSAQTQRPETRPIPYTDWRYNVIHVACLHTLHWPRGYLR